MGVAELRRRRLLANTFLVAAVLFCTALFAWSPANASFYPLCPIHEYLGILCPGCGATHALAVLLHGQVLKGLKPDDAPNLQKAIMPLVWLREYKSESGKPAQFLCSTIGAAVDLQNEDLRRLFVNASLWLTGREVPKRADVTLVGDYHPTYFGFNKARMGVKVAEHELK